MWSQQNEAFDGNHDRRREARDASRSVTIARIIIITHADRTADLIDEISTRPELRILL
jgi:hypothetical protein